MEDLPTISSNPVIQADYEQMRRAGQSHNMAEMLAFRQGPQIHGTDSGFMRGASGGKKWISQLGKRSDPSAYVSSADDLRAICKAKKLDCEGMVNCKYAAHGDAGPSEEYRVADDLVADAVKSRAENDPGLLQRKDKREVFEETREMISPVEGGM